MRVRVKICGITDPTDAVAAAELGVDAIGLVFHPASPRVVNLAQAREIRSVLPPFITVVGLFRDPEPSAVAEVLAAVPLDLLQFHGSEPPAWCRRHGRPYIKGIGVGAERDLAARIDAHRDASGILLDSAHGGGSGRRFDWSLIPRPLPRPLILAGGLDPGNVAAAIRQTHPYAVDVSSGVESAPGRKDPARIAAFMHEVHNVGSA